MDDCTELAVVYLLNELKSSEKINDEILMSLSSIFSPSVVLEAVKLVDDNNVVSLASSSGRRIFKVKGSNQRTYMVTPACLYCSCMSYNFQYLKKKSTFLCKHILATYLAKVEDSMVDDEELSRFLQSQSLGF